MSKKRRTKPFDLGSKTAEKYLDNLHQAVTSDTSAYKNEAASNGTASGSPSKDTSDTYVRDKRPFISDPIAKYIGLGIGVVTIIWVCIEVYHFFNSMSIAIDSTGKKVEKIEYTVDNMWRESGKYQEEAKGTSKLLLEKSDNLLNLSRDNKKEIDRINNINNINK